MDDRKTIKEYIDAWKQGKVQIFKSCEGVLVHESLMVEKLIGRVERREKKLLTVH